MPSTTPDDIVYYEPKMVIYLTEKDQQGTIDMNLFIVYDEDEDLIYVYGSRGYESRNNTNFVKFVKTFSCYNAMYNFISITMGFGVGHRLSISVNQMAGLTNYSEYHDFVSKVSRSNEIVAYDNTRITKRELMRYIFAYL
jgi:hypothetical protein